ncbi:MAG: CRISPR-associated endonuclease Cas1, partial [Shewanella sp.]
GRASLACDLVELLRHQVDRLVWDLVRHQLIRREHFTHEQQGACLLNKTGRQHFYEAYMLQAPQWLATLRRYSALFARHLDTQVAPWPATM